MEEKDYFKESRDIIEECGLDEATIRFMMSKAKREANRIFFPKRDEWSKAEKEIKIEGKYSDEEIVRKLANHILRQKLGKSSKEKEEDERA